MAHTKVRQRVVRVAVDGRWAVRPDMLAVEEPLEIRVDDVPFTVTMRTPGHDLDLALGFLVAEGTLSRPEDVVSARHCPDAARDADGRKTHNVVTVDLAPGVPPPAAVRHRLVSSACGICGSASIEAVRTRSRHDLATDDVRIDAAVLAGLPVRMREAQAVFERTGGLHAAALFTPAGDLICLREDVGRHNAVDKVVGWAFAAGRLPLRGHVLQVSGRASFELVQKAWMAGCPALAAVSAPSSLAAELAREAGMTLVGFSRGDRFSVYSGEPRITPGPGRDPEA
jgi:FdhD protein